MVFAGVQADQHWARLAPDVFDGAAVALRNVGDVAFGQRLGAANGASAPTASRFPSHYRRRSRDLDPGGLRELHRHTPTQMSGSTINGDFKVTIAEGDASTLRAIAESW